MRLMILLLALTTGSTPALAEPIPAQADRYQRDLTRAAHYTYGLTAPISTLAAMIHQESRWRHDALSPVGAQGLAQFMPATANWMPEIYPQLQTAQPFDPRWSIRAMVLYTEWLHQRVQAADNCQSWAFVLSAYNGGIGWVYRDQRLAEEHGYPKDQWFYAVELHNAGRSPANFRENRHYPRVILLEWSQLYHQNGWGPAACREAW